MQIELYDTTLRDGAQSEEISFTVEDKLRIAKKLDELGIHYIEGGWPGSNPKDEEFFARVRSLNLKNARIAAFGSTRKKGITAEKDPNLKALVAVGTPVVTIFGKSWDFHVKEALGISLEENLELIRDSISFLKKNCPEVLFDAEHFFDGFKKNPEYAVATLKAASEAGAKVLVLCDTNGGTLPDEIESIIKNVKNKFPSPLMGEGKGEGDPVLGFHGHNDSETGVANALAAVAAGCRHIQGTINGIGERCGNANLVSIIPNLQLKIGFSCIAPEQLSRLKEVSRYVDELANRIPLTHQPYVGEAAFAHKGGVHVSAILKNQATYEHIRPEEVGNRRRVLVSDLAGRSSILYKAKEFGIELDSQSSVVSGIVKQLKEMENAGYQFEGAEASFEILIRRALKQYKNFFTLIHFSVVDEKKGEDHGMAVPGHASAKATLEIEVNGKKERAEAKGVGPVNALDTALRKALERFYPELGKVRLIDYKVRVLPAGRATASQVRVLIESTDGREKWGTVGVSQNIIEASWMALVDSLEYKLLKSPFIPL
ncbi:MAG: citramalate synthase [Deltaproteobacteria bacterium]|nr:citramalate synthase [Deltaproteobacteria bacterium]